LTAHPGIQEGLILSTCNRVEVLVAAEDAADPATAVSRFLAQARQVEPHWLSPYLYHFEGRDAIRHLFRVACSLDSMVVGEPQILGQLKQAYAVAKAEGSVNSTLDQLLTRAFRVAKRVRSETAIGSNAVSVSYAAVELAREIFGSLYGRKVLVVGAGKMADLALRHLRRAGVGSVFVTNRTLERAQDLAREFQGSVIPYEQFLDAIQKVDILITSSGAPHYVLRRENMRPVMSKRRNRPVFIIDIAVPRNVEPEVNQLDGAFVYDIDDLQRVVERNLEGRRRVAEEAEEIVAEEVERMLNRLKAREVAPTIISLQGQLEQWRASEVERMRAKLGPLTPQQEEAVEALTRGIIQKVLHGPLTELRRSGGEPDSGAQVIALVRRMFRLGDE
jgi:glutamyl-tRNA reductase